MRALLCSLVLAGAVVSLTAPVPQVAAAPAPPPAETGPNAELEPEEMPGTATEPADPAAVARKIAEQKATRAARPLVTGFLKSPDALHVLPVGKRPYDSTEITPVGGFGLVDAQGVRMFRLSGSTRLYNHVVFQGSYALQNLNSYRLTGNPAYLDIATRNAQRLYDRRVASDGAWYYPYDFNFAPLGDASEMLPAPWYSGMAQGRVLSVFVRMFEATGDPKWRAAADATLASLSQGPSGRLPYGSYVDSQRHLWLEEYPRYPASMGENVLNGHIVAIWGLLDYWSLTGSGRAAELTRGAITTVRHLAMTTTPGFRRPAGSSLYSLRHKTPANTYHQMHIEQFLQLWGFTRNAWFITSATAYRGDYPNPPTAGTMRATPRTSTIYRVNAAMKVTATSRVNFPRVTHAPTDRRQRIAGGPVGLRVSKGPYTGWWFPEAHGTTWLLGAEDTHGYFPDAQVYIAPGTYTAYRLGPGGDISGRKTVRFTSTSNAPTALSGVVQARHVYYFTRGTYAGYWLPMVRGISVRSS